MCKTTKKLIGVGKNKEDKVILFPYLKKKIGKWNIWELIITKEQFYFIRNDYNKKYLMYDKKNISLGKIEMDALQNNSEKNKYEFRLLKLYQEMWEINSNQLKIIESEPIDLFMKYIDLRDKNVKREGIEQIYKDYDNEELRYSLRSIFEYIPWIRKIFIVMPNEKVRFLKPYEKINDKINYITDKNLLGYDSANIQAFLFNLYKMEKFGISKNFIYMEDDYFIGKTLKKSDFFYYDNKQKKIYPYVINTKFYEMNKKKILIKHNKLFNESNSIKPHSHSGYILSILNTDKYFLEKHKIPLITTKLTHCAIALNIDDLKEIFKEIQDYKYINETLFSKTRHVLTLNFQEFLYLYYLNIEHRKVHQINNTYIEIKNANLNILNKLYIELFVLNTGGNHIPSKEEYLNLTKVMKKRFPKPTIYEIPKLNI